jgi:outer membrane protein
MRLGRAALAAVLLFGLVSPAAADLRLGYIDSVRIFQEYKNAQEAQQRFDRQVQGWRDEASEKERTVNQLKAELRDQGPILSQLKRQEKEQAVQSAVSEYEKFIQDVWGPQGKATQENAAATGEVVSQIRSAVEKIAIDKNLNLVIDSAGGFIIYADRSLDLTPLVISELNTRAASANPNPK